MKTHIRSLIIPYALWHVVFPSTSKNGRKYRRITNLSLVSAGHIRILTVSSNTKLSLALEQEQLAKKVVKS